MYDQFYKKQIVKNMIWAAQIELLGLFSDDKGVTKVSSSERQEYKDYFISQALVEAKEYVISKMSDIDYSVEE